MAQERGRGWQARARSGLASARAWRLRLGLLACLAAAGAAASALALSGAAPATAAPAAPYYVFVLTNVASPGNIWVGQVSDLAGKDTCDFTDGGLCADAGGQNVPVTYTENLGPYPTCATATAAYNAAAMSPHPAFGGEKVYIFGNSYFIDDMSGWCVASGTTTTPATTTPTSTTTATTTTSEPAAQLPALPQAFCVKHAARASSLSPPPTPCAPSKAVSAAEKSEAREDLRGALYLTILFCGGSQSPVPALRLVYITSFVELCPRMIDLMGELLVTIHDPPAAGFAQVALIAASAAPAAPPACPKGASTAACAALRSAAAKFSSAATLNAEVGAAESLTLDRFAAAVAAQSVSGAFLQAAMANVYGGVVDGALTLQHQDAQALATALTNAGVDGTVPASAAVAAITAPGSSILSATLLNQLVADGVASSPALARQAIVAELDTVTGTLDSSQALDTALPVSALAKPYFAITLSDLKAIVKGLAAQGAVAHTPATSLLGDLKAAAKACGKRTGFVAATKRFSANATTVVKGEAGATLAFAVRPLTAASIPYASCA